MDLWYRKQPLYQLSHNHCPCLELLCVDNQLCSSSFLKIDNSWPIFHLFSSFQTTIITTNKCEKCPSSIQCWDSNQWPLAHESPPITTRPRLPPNAQVPLFVLYELSWKSSVEFEIKQNTSPHIFHIPSKQSGWQKWDITSVWPEKIAKCL